jgi:3-hydroxyacyl-[acyl-carrier-protein] dehydratase
MRWYLIDRFIEFESGKHAKAIKNISLAEDHMHDHFESYPVMPKSLIIEGLAQTGGLLVCEHGNFEEKVVLAKVPKIKFYSDAVPGDTLVYTVNVEQLNEYGAMVAVTSHQNGQLQAEGKMAFAHLSGAFDQTNLFDEGALHKMMRVLKAYDVGRTSDGRPLSDPDVNTK